MANQSIDVPSKFQNLQTDLMFEHGSTSFFSILDVFPDLWWSGDGLVTNGECNVEEEAAGEAEQGSAEQQ